MGRPVNKKHFGEVDTDSGNINVNCKVGSNSASVQGMIKSQRSSNKFLVDDAKEEYFLEWKKVKSLFVADTRSFTSWILSFLKFSKFFIEDFSKSFSILKGPLFLKKGFNIKELLSKI